MTPIFIPAPRPSRSAEEIAFAESLKRYSTQEERMAFEAGAKFERGDSNVSITFMLLFLFCIIFLTVQFGFFTFGIMDGPRSTYSGGKIYSLKGKWKYVFPGYAAGTYLNEFMKDKE